MNVYDKIDLKLKEKRISRRKLAIMAGISPSSLQSAFSRKSDDISSGMLRKIAFALDCSVDDLLEDSQNPFIENIKLLAEHQRDSFLEKLDGLLSEGKASELLNALNSTIDGIFKLKYGQEYVEGLGRLTAIISTYGQMINDIREFESNTIHDPVNSFMRYLAFLDSFERLQNTITEHKIFLEKKAIEITDTEIELVSAGNKEMYEFRKRLRSHLG